MKSYSEQCLVSAGNEMQEKRILIVDDDEMLLNLLSSMITMMGFEVDTAGNGDEAIYQFMQKSFDIVLTDLNMPGMDGWCLARQIKCLSPDTPVVLATADARKRILGKIADSSVDLVLFKPFGFKEFQATVQKVLCVT
jgi:two-component system capsular synthesis sensor histidine kinase RcsC